MRTKLLSWLAAAGLVVGLAQPVGAAILTITLDFEFSGGDTPDGTLTAVFDDSFGDADTVQLTLTSNLVDAEFVSWWGFNIKDNLDGDSLDAMATMGSFDTFTTNTANNDVACCKADGDGFFDFVFEFITDGDTFGFGDEVVIILSLSGGLEASDFNLDSIKGGGNGTYVSAAHIQGVDAAGDGGCSGSGWIGNGSVVISSIGSFFISPAYAQTGGCTPIPLPGAIVLFGSVLVGFFGIAAYKGLRSQENAWHKAGH